MACSKMIEDLVKMEHCAQEEFSKDIEAVRKKLDDLKLLQKLIKQEEKK